MIQQGQAGESPRRSAVGEQTQRPFGDGWDVAPAQNKSQEEAYKEANEREAMVREFLGEMGILSYALTPGSQHPFVMRKGETHSLGYQSHQLDIGVGRYRGEIKAFNVPLFETPNHYKYVDVLLDDLDGISKKVAAPDFYIVLSQQTTIEDLRKGHGALFVPYRLSKYHGYLKHKEVYASNDGFIKPSLACPRRHCLGVDAAVDALRLIQYVSYEEKKEKDRRWET
jgi:hypothetical protein